MRKTVGKKLSTPSVKIEVEDNKAVYIPDFNFRQYITNGEGEIKTSVKTIPMVFPGCEFAIQLFNLKDKDLYVEVGKTIYYTTDVKIADLPFFPQPHVFTVDPQTHVFTVDPQTHVFTADSEILPMNKSLHHIFFHIDKIFDLGGKFEVTVGGQKYIYMENFDDLDVIFSN
jgi:hypothetical protein